MDETININVKCSLLCITRKHIDQKAYVKENERHKQSDDFSKTNATGIYRLKTSFVLSRIL